MSKDNEYSFGKNVSVHCDRKDSFDLILFPN